MSAKLKFARPLALAGLIAVAAMPAFAADAIESVPEPAVPMEEAPIATWTGPYAGVNLGYGFAGKAKEPGNSVDTDGIMGSGFVGYQHQFDNGVVAGVEGEAGYSGVEGRENGTRVRSGVDGSLRARLGYAVTPDVLPYVTAGGAAKQMKASEGGRSDTNTMLGWTAGAGVDVKMTEQTFVRGEYRYTDFGSDDFTTGSGTRKIDSTDHRVNLGVGFKF